MTLSGQLDTYQSYGYPFANVSNTPYRLFKVSTHAGGINTPLIVHWPARIKAHGDLRRPQGHLADLMATCLDVTGAAYPRTREGEDVTPLEGRSLVPAFEDTAIARDAICFEHEGKRAIPAGDYKLVPSGSKGPWELYDVRIDRTELSDLAASRPETVEGLAAKWTEWAARTLVFPKPGPEV